MFGSQAGRPPRQGAHAAGPARRARRGAPPPLSAGCSAPRAAQGPDRAQQATVSETVDRRLRPGFTGGFVRHFLLRARLPRARRCGVGHHSRVAVPECRRRAGRLPVDRRLAVRRRWVRDRGTDPWRPQMAMAVRTSGTSTRCRGDRAPGSDAASGFPPLWPDAARPRRATPQAPANEKQSTRTSASRRPSLMPCELLFATDGDAPAIAFCDRRCNPHRRNRS
jgi:hypothetical protein